jgi:phosphohistidine phosphatase SixA
MARWTDLRRIAWSMAAALVVFVAPARADEALWNLLKQGGQVVLIRHATTTPGVGDPPGMKLEDCKSQRNLSDEGRAEAKRLGVSLRDRKVPVGVVMSSPWCRCLETARLALGKEAQVEASLSNLFGRQEKSDAQVAALRKVVDRLPREGNAFLFTHGSTVVALTGLSPAQAEMVVLTPQVGGGFKVAGRLPSP